MFFFLSIIFFLWANEWWDQVGRCWRIGGPIRIRQARRSDRSARAATSKRSRSNIRSQSGPTKSSEAGCLCSPYNPSELLLYSDWPIGASRPPQRQATRHSIKWSPPSPSACRQEVECCGCCCCRCCAMLCLREFLECCLVQARRLKIQGRVGWVPYDTWLHPLRGRWQRPLDCCPKEKKEKLRDAKSRGFLFPFLLVLSPFEVLCPSPPSPSPPSSRVPPFHCSPPLASSLLDQVPSN